MRKWLVRMLSNAIECNRAKWLVRMLSNAIECNRAKWVVRMQSNAIECNRKIVLLVLLASCFGVAAEDLPWYVGSAGGMLLPGSGNSLEKAAEVDVYAGQYVSDYWAVEGVLMCAPNVGSDAGNETLSGVGARMLGHFSGWEAYDKLFGCERFDPFVTVGGACRFGSQHVFASDSHRTATGLTWGIGFLYHLTNNLDIRFESQAMLACDLPCAMMYDVVLGLQWNFDGGLE